MTSHQFTYPKVSPVAVAPTAHGDKAQPVSAPPKR